MRPVWATLNKTLIHNANAVNPLKNREYAVLVVYSGRTYYKLMALGLSTISIVVECLLLTCYWKK